MDGEGGQLRIQQMARRSVSFSDVRFVFFFSSRRRHTRFDCDWSSDVCSSDLRFDQTQKRFADGARNHRGLRRTLLLLENQQWLVEMGIAARDLLLQYGDLCILATQAENRGAGYVRMVDVTREQTAQIIGVLPRAPTAAFMHQEFDPVDISKHS